MGNETAPPGSGQRSGQVAKERASEAVDKARESAGEVASTAQEQARGVVDESRTQIRHVTSEVRGRIGEETRTQTQRASQTLRHWSDDLASMAEGADADSPVSGVVRRVAASGHDAADFLDERGVEGMAEEVRSFARRRPGVFLVGAVLAGFAVGRLAKAVTQDSAEGAGTAPGRTGGSSAPGRPAPESRSAPRPRQEGMAVPGIPLSPETHEAPGAARYDVPPHDSPHERSPRPEGS